MKKTDPLKKCYHMIATAERVWYTSGVNPDLRSENMGTVSTPEEINEFLRQVKHHVSKGRRQVEERTKNLRTLSDLEMTKAEMWSEISQLTFKDYVAGPEPDDDPNRPRNEWWKFGKTINGVDVYIKLRIHKNRVVICLSFHQAEHPLRFPY